MTNDWELHQVTLSRTSGFGLGMAVAGGVDSPFIAGDSAVIVSDVLRDGPAEGKLCVGDRLLSVNGISLLDVSHSFAIKQLKLAGNTVDLVVHRRLGSPPLSNQIMSSNNSNNNVNIINGPQSTMDLSGSINASAPPEIVLARRGTWEDLGMNLGCHLFISSLNEGSLAQREGLQVGDLITSINGIKADHISLIDAVSLISRRDEVRVTVQRPSDSARRFHERTRPDPSLTNQLSQLSLQSSSQPVASSSRVDLIKPRSWDQLNTSANPQIVQPPIPPHRAIPNHARTEPRARRVAFQREPLRGTGLRIVGGNASGIFVASVERGSPAEGAGLREGDRILKVGSLDTHNLTKEEVALELIGQEGVVEMSVAPAPNEYSRLLSSGESGDSLFIRVHFDYRGGTGAGGGGGGSTSSSTSSVAQAGHEAGFRRGEIFHVLDTLHGGVVGSWRALRVHPPSPAGATEMIIPNENRAQQLALTGGRTGSTRSNNVSSIMRRKRSKSATPSGGARTSADPPSVSSASSTSLSAWERAFFGTEGPSPEPFPPYERVVHRHPGFVRPVVLFGPLADVARERLLREMPDKFAPVTPPTVMNGDLKEATRSSAIKLSSIRTVLDAGRHALLDITPGAVQRLNFAQMAPIVLYLRPEGKSANKELRSQYSRYSGRNGKRLLEESASMENLAGHLFTGVVPITAATNSHNHSAGLNDWFTRLIEMVDHQQREPTWVTAEPSGVTSPRLNARRFMRPDEDAELTLRRHRTPWSTEAELARLSAPNLIERIPDGAELEPTIRAVEGTLTRSISDPHMLSPSKANRNDDWQLQEDPLRMQAYTVGRSRGRALAPNGSSGFLDQRLNRSMGLENFIYMAPHADPELPPRRQYTSSTALFNDLIGEKSGSRGMGLDMAAEVDPYAVHTLPGRGRRLASNMSAGDGYATVKPRSAIQHQKQHSQPQPHQSQPPPVVGPHDTYRYVRSSAMTANNQGRPDLVFPAAKVAPPVAPKPLTQRSIQAQVTSENFAPTSQSYSYSGPNRGQATPPVSQYLQQQVPQSSNSVFNSSAQLRLQARSQAPPNAEPANASSRSVFGHRLEPILTPSCGGEQQRSEPPSTSEATQRRRGRPEDLEIVAEKSGMFDDRGGILEAPEHGVSLRIPPGALTPGCAKKEVYFKIYRENGLQLPHMLSKSGDINGVQSNGNGVGSATGSTGSSGATLISPLVMCGPHGLRFNRPVELRMPHRPDLRPDAWQFSLLHSSSETGHPGDWKETRVGAKFPSGATPRVLDNGQISVMVDHF